MTAFTFFRKLFNPVKASSEEVPTEPIPEPQEAPLENTAQTEPMETSPLAPPQLLAACAQSVGMQRDHNEDSLFMLTSTMVSDHTGMPFGIYIVADGMGGHKHGEVASSLAVRALGSYIVRKLYTALLGVKPGMPEDSIQEILQAGIQEAHQTINQEAPGGGTTLTAVLVLGEQITVAHIGDSRAYTLTQAGELSQLTRDHSLVKRLVELGQITNEEAATHPQRNVLYRALGQGESFEADINTMPLPHAAYLLVCSDGLWGVVPEDMLIHLILTSPTLDQACQKMVDAANAAGGPDNITAVLIQLPA